MWRAILPALFFLTACNSLFYYPDAVGYYIPGKLGKDYAQFSFASEGNTLYGWRLFHEGNCKGSVIQLHGNAQNMSSHFVALGWVTEFGYDLITFDYRGYGVSEGTPSRKGLVEDAKNLFSEIQSQKMGCAPYYIVGQSLGGAVAIPALSDSSLPIKAVVLESSFASYREIAQDKLNGFFLTWPFQWFLRYLVSDEYSAADSIRSLKVPLLILHSRQDPVVPYDQGRKLFELASEPKTFWEVEGLGHTHAFVNENSPLRKKLIDYFEHL